MRFSNPGMDPHKDAIEGAPDPWSGVSGDNMRLYAPLADNPDAYQDCDMCRHIGPHDHAADLEYSNLLRADRKAWSAAWIGTGTVVGVVTVLGIALLWFYQWAVGVSS